MGLRIGVLAGAEVTRATRGDADSVAIDDDVLDADLAGLFAEGADLEV